MDYCIWLLHIIGEPTNFQSYAITETLQEEKGFMRREVSEDMCEWTEKLYLLHPSYVNEKKGEDNTQIDN